MKEFVCISIPQAKSFLTAGRALLIDIRDPQSFDAAHVSGSLLMTKDNLDIFLKELDFDTPILVLCYHGISSKGMASYLVHLGFDQVYSVDGGFEVWRTTFPDEITSNLRRA